MLGLEYLHSKGVVHSDLKGANVLFDSEGNVKLADFGASKFIPNLPAVSASASEMCNSVKGSFYWMAPEMLMEKGHGRKIDIWSLGCIMIEMATASHPWPYVKTFPDLIVAISKQETPPIPEHLSATAKDFVMQCLQYDKKLRPRPKVLL